MNRHMSRFPMKTAVSSLPVALLLALSACQPPGPAVQRVELGEGWTFAGADTFTTGFSATVPGTVHTDLLANGLIPDPFRRDNETRLQWIGEEDWRYRITFQADSWFMESDRVELVFHGLDTFAEVILNGTSILEADNMFRAWRVDVSRQLRSGENQLEVRFRSPLPQGLAAYRALPYQLPAGNDRGDPPTRVFVRKAAYHYGWDWGPRFVTQGIWRPVELVAWRGARLTDVHVSTDSISPEAALLTAHVEVEATVSEVEQRAAGGAVPVTLTIFHPDGGFPTVSFEAVLEPGLNRYSLPFRIPEPELWWPNGLGNPHLYEVQVALNAGLRTDTASTRLGIRSVELVTEADSIGESFFFRVNGLPVFMKGANVIPLDHFSPRATAEDYRDLFRDVVAANMNMLRVWGGGIYERDVFYELADQHGILIWQDFMFANGMYPGDSDFLENVREEARHQVRRLRSHPSLALWCGNNEMDEGWQRWGWARAYDTPEDSAAVRDAYEAIFHDILPGVVAEEDPARRYWPSSPSLGWGDPESLNRGDSHYWGVWHGREPFQVFTEKLPRFSSEYGFQAFPPMASIRAFTEEEDRSLNDPVLLVHQKHPTGNELILEYMERDYPVPSSFQDLVYVSQLLQARGMRMALEAHRRAVPRTMGTLYWQLNDTWPAVSWSGRDYFRRWKALHYAARDAFAPELVSPFLNGDTAEVWVVAPEGEGVEGTLALKLMDFQGTTLWEMPQAVQVSAGESRRVWSQDVASLLNGRNPAQVVFSATLPREQTEGDAAQPTWDPDGLRQPALLYFVAPRAMALAAPAIQLEWDQREGVITLSLTSDVLAKDVYLSVEPAEGEVHHFSDNFFDLLPGVARTVSLRTSLSLDDLPPRFRVRTLAEVPREGVPAEGPVPPI